jgi:predicted chitinase
MSPMRIAQDMLNKKSKLYKILSRQYDERGIMEKLRLYTFFANRLLTFDGGKISEENLDYSLFTQSEINLLKRRGIYE